MVSEIHSEHSDSYDERRGRARSRERDRDNSPDHRAQEADGPFGVEPPPALLPPGQGAPAPQPQPQPQPQPPFRTGAEQRFVSIEHAHCDFMMQALQGVYGPKVQQLLVQSSLFWSDYALRESHPGLRHATQWELLEKKVDATNIGLLDPHCTQLRKLNERSLGAVQAFVRSIDPVSPGMSIEEEILALARLSLAQEGSSGQGLGGGLLRPRLPNAPEYSGPKSGDRVVTLKELHLWLESVSTMCQITGLDKDAPRMVLFAAQLLKGHALAWWSTWPKATSCSTWEEFREGLTTRFVGAHPFELLCGELEGLKLTSFRSFDQFHATFVQTVVTMRAYAPAPERMWHDTVLIDKLLISLSGTLYYEGVALNKNTQLRPTTYVEAMECLVTHHDSLVQRGQEHKGDRSKANGNDTPPTHTIRKADRERGGKRKALPGGGGGGASGGASGSRNPKRSKDPASTHDNLRTRFMRMFDLPGEVVDHRMRKVSYKGDMVYPCMKCGNKNHTHSACRNAVVAKIIPENR